MNDDEIDEVPLLEVLEPVDLVDPELVPVEDDYEPTEEIILLDMQHVDDDELLEVA